MRSDSQFMICEVCQQAVTPSVAGFGPWCDLYFGERRTSCLPRVLKAIQWVRSQNRDHDASVLVEYARRHWDLSGVELP